jgi:starch phosphorylase
MEFGLHEQLPIYSGGLGVLAGDVLKSAHDLGLPLVGVGLFWSEGYGRQRIDRWGLPRHETWPTPRRVLEPVALDGDVDLAVEIAGSRVPLAAWKVTAYSNAPLYLLEPARREDRWITQRLYGGDAQDRVAQEIVLGVGGIRLLEALRLDVDVIHLNEGHAVFAGLELVRAELAGGATLDEAVASVRERLVFTTHTPVDAGNERHKLALLAEMGADCGLSPAALATIGGDPFCMTVAGLRLASLANAVAERHGETVRRMWRSVDDAAPVVAITNGVHVPTWQDERLRAARTHEELWHAHQTCKGDLLATIAGRTGVHFDAERLLVGFARRATAYKRPDLILGDPERLDALLDDPQHRLQIVFAGKAHPADLEGQEIVTRLVAAARRWPGQVVFLEDYDLRLGELLTRGCDVWLNNPIPPMEASGTSGMKAAMNGVLNLSVLDGWWPEGCRHGETGWRIIHADDSTDPDERDALDREDLFRVLETTVLPTYYQDRSRWLEMMERSMAMAVTRFSSDRMLDSYYRELYEPCVSSRARRDGRGRVSASRT